MQPNPSLRERLRSYLFRPTWHEVAGAAAVLLLLLPLALIHPEPVQGLFLWLLAGAWVTRLIRLHLERYRSALRTRAATISSPRWSIAINDVPVATLSDAHYAALRLDAFNDPRLYLYQAVTHCQQLAGTLLHVLYYALPGFLLWGAVVLAVVEPEVFATSLRELGKLSAQDAARLIGQSLPTVLAIACGVSLFVWQLKLMGAPSMLLNRFEDAVQLRIRQLFRVPAEGSLTMYRDVSSNGASRRVYANERPHLRTGASNALRAATR